MADMDSAAKRRSAINLGSPWRAGMLDPASIDQASRQTFLFGYSGILWSAPVGFVTGDSLGLDQIGASVTLRKVSATNWGIV